MINDSLVIGTDIGGTHITAALVDIKNKAILTDSLVRREFDSNASATEIIEIWSKAISEAAKNASTDKLSLAIPGPFDYDNGICLIKEQNKYGSLYGLNIKELLAGKLNFKPENISMINDAAAFLQGETFSGAASGYKNAIGVTLGTGLGTCVFQNEISTDAGLWNMPFGDGIAEDYLCTRWFTKRYFDLTGNKISGVRQLLGRADNNIIRQIFNEFGENLAKFLIDFISKSLPNVKVVVLGGNIAKSFSYFEKYLTDALKLEFPFIAIKMAQFGEEAALLGAAIYWGTKKNQFIQY